MQKHIEIKIVGQVQGVFFRQTAKKIADNLGLVGLVRNETDGSVRIAAEGEEKNLQKLIEWCKTGTEHSRVEDVHTIWCDTENEFQSFVIL